MQQNPIDLIFTLSVLCLSTARFFKWLITFPLRLVYQKTSTKGRGFKPKIFGNFFNVVYKNYR
jgi:hypothetical protein